MHEMTLPIRPDGGNDDMALPAHFRERFMDEQSQAQAFERFACERPLLYRFLRCCQSGFLQDFEAITDQIILELRSGQSNTARFYGDGRQRQPGFLAILGERARIDQTEGHPHLAKKCIEYIGCGLEGLPDRLRNSWFFSAGGGLLSVSQPVGEGGTPPVVAILGGTDFGGDGALSPEWEALAVQGAREALLCAVGLSCLAVADVTRGRSEGSEEGLLLDLLVAAEGATHVVLQVITGVRLPSYSAAD